MTGRPSLKTRLFQALAEGKRIEFKRTPVSADLVRTVILGQGAPPELAQLRTVSQAALRIAGAVIEGRLDLSHMSGPGGGVLPALCFEDCLFEGGISIEGSAFSGFTLRDCRFRPSDDELPTIDLSRALVGNDVVVTGANPGEEGGICWIAGDNAVIDGNLELDRSLFRSPPARKDVHISGKMRYAVSFKGTEIKGRVTCVGGVVADGGFYFMDAHIGGDAWFSGAHAIAREGDAFNGQSVLIEGALSFNALADVDGGAELRPFRAAGAVKLQNARIRGGLRCGDIRIFNPNGPSLSLIDAEIGKMFSIQGDKTSALGRARLFGTIHLENAAISGDFRVFGAALGSASDYPAISADGMRCHHAVNIHDVMPLSKKTTHANGAAAFLASARIPEDGFSGSFGPELYDRYLYNTLVFHSSEVGRFQIDNASIIFGGIGATAMTCAGDCEIRPACFGDILLNSLTVSTGSLKLNGLALTSLGANRAQLSLRDAEVRRSIETRRDTMSGQQELSALAIRSKSLACLPDFDFVEVLWSGSGCRMSGHLVRRGAPLYSSAQAGGSGQRRQIFDLGGKSEIFHDLYRQGALNVSDDSAEELLRLFCNYLQGEDGAFRIVEPGDPFPQGLKVDRQAAQTQLDEMRARVEQILTSGDEAASAQLPALESELAFLTILADPALTDEAFVSVLEQRIKPMQMTVRDGLHVGQTYMLYSKYVYRVELSVDPNSPRDHQIKVQMLNDEIVTPELTNPLRFDGRVVSSSAATGWPLGPGLPGMRDLEGMELDRMRDIMRDHHLDIAGLNSALVDLEDAQCDTLRDGGGRDWGSKVQLKLNRFSYRHADDADRLLVMDKSWLGRLKRKMGIGNDPVVRARLDWLMQSYQPRTEGPPTARQLRDDYCPQPFEQLIQVARSSGNEVMATTIEIEKAKIEAGRFTARMRGLLAGAGAVGAVLWGLWHGVSGILDAVFLAAIFLLITFLFDLGNIGIRSMFGYLRRPVNAVVALAAWIVVGSIGVHAANSRGQMVVDVVPTASGLEPANGRYATPVIEGRAFDAVPCGTEINEVLYAVDVFIPLIDLRQESRCTVGESSLASAATPLPDGAGWWSRQAADIRARTIDSETFWEVLKAVYSVLGWLVLSLAILTFARIDRRVQEP